MTFNDTQFQASALPSMAAPFEPLLPPEAVATPLQRAMRATALEAECRGYIAGARAGRLAGFVWGLLMGAVATAGALQMGLRLGAGL